MLKSIKFLSRFMTRFRYPISLPEHVTEALWVRASNFLSFDELIKMLLSSSCNPLTLAKYMPRKEAESAFKNATSVEQFSDKTLVTYCFLEGCIEFILNFDKDSRLRRIYLTHKSIPDEQGVEISLSSSYIGRHHPKNSKAPRASY